MEHLVDAYAPNASRSTKSILLFSLKELLVLTVFFAFTLLFIPIFTYFYFASDLQTKDSLMNRNDTGIILTDRNDKPFFSFYSAKKKSQVSLNELSKYTKDAVIAVEDKRFYQHDGFSIPSMIGAFIADLKNKDFKYGGSTITQQLVKNSLLSSDKNLLRKYQELVLAYEVERRFTKDEILEMYLNSVYFGEGAFGIQEAAHQYFDKDAKDLNLAESAMLAGVLPAPSKFSPISGSEALAKERQNYVLRKMMEQHLITGDDKKMANETTLTYSSDRDDLNRSAPHFALMVKDELVEKYGEENVARSGFKVKTTLDLNLQTYAEQVVSDHVNQLKKDSVTNGAAVVEDPKTGEILALVGSADWYNNNFGKVNLATSQRSPGSSFKPIVYAKAFEKRVITPSSILNDSPVTYKPGPGVANSDYSPQDFDRRFRGKVTVRRALSNSLNVPAVEVLTKVGIPDALEMAQRLGITSLKKPSNYGLSLVLGTGEISLVEMTNAYATFANNGIKNEPTLVLEITNKYKQKTYAYQPRGEKVLDEGTAFLISSILSDNKTRAEQFGNNLNISKTAAVKTGTAESFRDSLTLGYTPSVAVGVWVGNNNNKPMKQVAGSLGAAPIWKKLMERYLADKPAEDFKPPDGVTLATACRNSFALIKEARAEEPSPSPASSPPPASPSATFKEYYLKGTEPKVACAAPKPPAPSSTPQSSQAPAPTPEQGPQGGPQQIQVSGNGDEIRIEINNGQVKVEEKKKD